MKYKVGDIVKLRDDLEFGKYYGGMQLSETFHGGIIGKKGKIKRCASYGYWTMFKGGRVWCDITDEMIEGLWEECKSSEQVSKSEGKYKLIDILNKIANGELKEGTKVKIIDGGEEFTYERCITDIGNHELVNKEGEYIFENYHIDIISDEVELIEPDHFPDVGKMAEPTECEHEWKIGGIRDTIDPLEVVAFQHCEKCGMTKIMETKKQENHKEAEHFRDDTKMIEPTDNTKIEELDENKYILKGMADVVVDTFYKLNEVIRYINK